MWEFLHDKCKIHGTGGTAVEFAALYRRCCKLAQWNHCLSVTSFFFFFLSKSLPPPVCTQPPPLFAAQTVHRNRKQRAPWASGVAFDRRGSPFVSASAMVMALQLF